MSQTTRIDNAEVVLVEDNPHDIEITMRAFQQHFNVDRVLVLKNGEEALRYFESLESRAALSEITLPRLVLLDIKLPLVSGLEVLNHVKQSPHLRKIPVVMLTSSREDRDITESYDHGANSYLVKPINYNDFKMLSGLLSPYWLRLNQLPYTSQ